LLGEHVIRSMEEGLLVERPDTVCIVCNPAAVGLLDVRLADLVGERGTIERTLGDDLYAALVKRAREEPDQPPLVMSWGARDLVFDSYEVPDVRGEAMNLMVIIRDVTAVLETERLKRDLVSIVSHELRTPLTVLTSAVEMIAETAAPEQRAVAESAQRNVARMRDMVNDLLDLARLESGQAEIEPREVDLVALCQETATLLRPQADAKQTGISVHAAGAAIPVECDPRHLGRAVTNLASNAVKFTPAGGHVWIECGVEGGRAFVNVIDNGPGIPAEEQPKIFNRFFRASNTRSKIGGTGLGLSIVVQIMEMHGGTTTLVHSDPTGSRFRLEWPARAARPAGPAEARP
jgi:signal transduction histidine kinase